jgi:hypothetical protein
LGLLDPGLIGLEKDAVQRQASLELLLDLRGGSAVSTGRRRRDGHAGVGGCRLALVVGHVAGDAAAPVERPVESKVAVRRCR